MRRLLVTAAVASACGTALIATASCSSSSSPSPAKEAGADVTTKDVARDTAPSDVAKEKDAGPADAPQETTTEAGCTQEPEGGPTKDNILPDGAAVSEGGLPSCSYTAGNCLGVGAPCTIGDGGVTLSGCDLADTNFPTSQSAFACIVAPPWNPELASSQTTGFCSPFFESTTTCPACGPGASCCSSASLNFAFCYPTSCVAPLLATPQSVDGSAGMQGMTAPPDTKCSP